MSKAKYIQLKEYLRRLIEEQELKPGEKIPSQKELTEEFGIGRLTARHAIGQLVNEGYLNSQQGKGTFVTNYAWRVKNNELKETLMLLFSEEPSRLPNPHFITFIQGAAAEVRRQNTRLCVFDIPTGSSLVDLPRVLEEGWVRGVILLGITNPAIINHLAKNRIPFVLAHERAQGDRLYYVGTANKQGAIEMVRYLVEIGHKKIGMLNSYQQEHSFLRERYEGYRLGMEKNGIKIRDEHVIKKPDKKRISELIGERDGPSAIFCGTDFEAFEVMAIAWQKGVAIPNDFAVVGFGGSELGAYSMPPLTTMQEQFYEMGRIALRQLWSLVSGKEIAKRNIELKSKLVIRDSCGFRKSKEHSIDFH